MNVSLRDSDQSVPFCHYHGETRMQVSVCYVDLRRFDADCCLVGLGALSVRPPAADYARIAGFEPLRATIALIRSTDNPRFGADMSKRARKRRSRKGNAANHGRKPNA